MMHDKDYVNVAVQTGHGISIRGTAELLGDRWISIQSSEFIPPGTDVETVLYLNKPERVRGEVGWTLAEPGNDKIVYKMGIRLPHEPVIGECTSVTTASSHN